jgi:hypothetical protein
MTAAPRQIPAPVLDRTGKACVALLVFLGIGALPSGFLMAGWPDGSKFGITTTWLAGSPFSDYLIPGLILLLLFGVGSLVVAVLGARKAPIAPFLAFAIGVGMVIWVVVELAVIKQPSFLQVMYGMLGAALAVVSVRWGWATFQGWRSRGA